MNQIFKQKAFWITLLPIIGISIIYGMSVLQLIDYTQKQSFFLSWQEAIVIISLIALSIYIYKRK